MKILVVQSGARMGYAVPHVLAQAGLLERFYTDVAGNASWVRWVHGVARLLPANNPLARLANRQLPPAISSKTVTFPARSLAYAIISRFAKTAEDGFRAHLRCSAKLGEAMARAGYGSATHVYSMLGEFGPFLTEGNRRGLKVVVDVYTPLSLERIVAEERCSFPGWEPDVPDFAAIRRDAQREDALLARSDHFICPSPNVQDDLVTNFGVSRARTSLVPHGVAAYWFELDARPVPRRVLFAGAANLGKGIHYLGMATERLMARGHRYDFRVAGDVTSRIAEQPVCRHLRFLGRVPRDRVQEEFAAADVVVLPSLAEGSAGVTYEALGAGVPVVTTRAAGSVVRDGIEGRIVPERDPAALADALAEIVEDRDQRARMSVAARQRAREFTWERYGERLTTALTGCLA
jgi:glycosyltransferase involved in cell wall biosynthesis